MQNVDTSVVSGVVFNSIVCTLRAIKSAWFLEHQKFAGRYGQHQLLNDLVKEHESLENGFQFILREL